MKEQHALVTQGLEYSIQLLYINNVTRNVGCFMNYNSLHGLS